MKLYLDGEEIMSRALSGLLDKDDSIDVVVGANPVGAFN